MLVHNSGIIRNMSFPISFDLFQKTKFCAVLLKEILDLAQCLKMKLKQFLTQFRCPLQNFFQLIYLSTTQNFHFRMRSIIEQRDNTKTHWLICPPSINTSFLIFTATIKGRHTPYPSPNSTPKGRIHLPYEFPRSGQLLNTCQPRLTCNRRWLRHRAVAKEDRNPMRWNWRCGRRRRCSRGCSHDWRCRERVVAVLVQKSMLSAVGWIKIEAGSQATQRHRWPGLGLSLWSNERRLSQVFWYRSNMIICCVLGEVSPSEGIRFDNPSTGDWSGRVIILFFCRCGQHFAAVCVVKGQLLEEDNRVCQCWSE